MKNQHKILLISLGSIGKRHLRNMRALMPNAQIGVLRQHIQGDVSLPNGADFLFRDISEALQFKPECVVISSPASQHIEHAGLFYKSGASLFIEKPLAPCLEATSQFLSAPSESHPFMMVGYVLRFLPLLATLKNALDRGEYGIVRTAHIQVGQYLPDWRVGSDYRQGVSAQKSLGGGALLELSHEIDYALWLFGRPQSLLCSLGTLSNLEIDVEDSALLVFEYSKDQQQRVIISLDFLQRVAHMAVEVVTSEVTLRADLISEEIVCFSPKNPDGIALEFPKSQDGNEIYLKQFDFFLSKSFADYQARFPDNHLPNSHVDIGAAQQVLEVIDQARIAHSSGKRVHI